MNIFKITSKITTRLSIFVFIEVAIFFWIISRPISWQQGEIIYHHLFWSIDSFQDYRMHLGLRFIDFLKPFSADSVDHFFRLRQFSYFLEMLSFKLWQFLGLATLKDPTIIMIHFCNTYLLGRIVFLITGKIKAGILSAGLFLNCGIALGTIMFPFRNAKLFVMTLFLMVWVVILTTKEPWAEAGAKRWMAVLLLALCAFFTDEIALFIFPILICAVIIKDGWDLVYKKRFYLWLGGFISLYTILATIFLHISKNIDPRFSLWVYRVQMPKYATFFTQWTTLRDIAVSFFAYFLSRNFGYWDHTYLGILAFLASIALFVVFLSAKKERREARLCWCIVVILLLKTLLLPHNANVHDIVMPKETTFASLLFFGWYYPYCEALMVCLLIGLLIKNQTERARVFCFSLGAVMLISVSSAFHLRNGTPDALRFHSWHKEEYRQHKQMIAGKVLAIKDLMNRYARKKIYLSFPSGDEEIYTRDILTVKPNLYASLIPVLYLKYIQEGRLALSLRNISVGQTDPLFKSDIFYDVVQKKVFFLEPLRKFSATESFKPITTRGLTVIEQTVPKDFILLLKGRSRLWCSQQERRIYDEQTYGESYQIFEFKKNSICDLHIQPIDDQGKVHIIGPLYYDGKDELLIPDGYRIH